MKKKKEFEEVLLDKSQINTIEIPKMEKKIIISKAPETLTKKINLDNSVKKKLKKLSS